MVAYPDHGAGNDPKQVMTFFFFFFFFFGGGGRLEWEGAYSFTTKAQHFYSGEYGSNELN